MRPEGQVSSGGGGELWLSETELRSKFAIEGWGGAHLERVSVSQLGGFVRSMLPRETFMKWLEMHLKLTWCDEAYILSATKDVAIKKLFSTKRMIQQQVFSEPSTLFDNGSLAPC